MALWTQTFLHLDRILVRGYRQFLVEFFPGAKWG